MRAVVAGGRGQLGRSLARRGAAAGHAVAALAREALDVTREDTLGPALDRALSGLAARAAPGAPPEPAVIINAAAYTAVDRAEAERARAFAVNATGAGALARAAAARGVPLIHVSTDYVFDGAATAPIPEEAAVAPLGAYGASKAAGEELVRAAGGAVVRTSWLFAAGGAGFVQAIARQARAAAVLRVVADQRGRPTWAEDLADALLALAARPARPPVLHLAGAPATTWHGLACAVVAELARAQRIACARVDAIATADYPTAARRPAYSVLATARAEALGLALPPWEPGLARTIAEDVAAASG
jgi:dTDP-4-dehydrorhamnose reductase